MGKTSVYNDLVLMSLLSKLLFVDTKEYRLNTYTWQEISAASKVLGEPGSSGVGPGGRSSTLL